MARKPPSDTKPTTDAGMPKSLEGHVIPPERMAMITPHVALLAATALTANDALPLQADASDYARVLEEEAR